MSKTSTAAKRVWNNKNYGRLQIQLQIDIVKSFKDECKKRGVSQAEVVKQAIESFLQKK